MTALGSNKFSVKLIGEVKDGGLAKRLEDSVEALGDNLRVLSLIEVTKPAGKETQIWFLTYPRQALSKTEGTSTGTGDAKTDPKTAIGMWIEAFKHTHPGSEIDLAGNNRLLLSGTHEQVVEMKRQLTLIDTPYPQVQLSLWAVQVSGSDRCIAERTAWIQERIRTTRDRMNQVKALFKDKVRWDCEPGKCSGRRHDIDIQAKKAGLRLDARSSLSLNEALILFLVGERSQDAVAALQKETRNFQNGWALADAEELKEARDCVTLSAPAVPTSTPFPRLAALVAQSPVAHYQDFQDFLAALDKFRDPSDSNAPGNLSRKGAAVDRELKDAMDAFSEDMNELLFTPLMAELRNLAVPRCGDDGVTLVGQSRIVVTSTQRSFLEAQMSSSVETTRPRPFGQALLDKAKGLATPAATPSAIDTAIGALSNSQTFVLAAALLEEPQPTFTELAPGISISVRPTVLPDGGAARLLIDARFGVGTSALNADPARTDVWAQAPPSAIASHHMTTDAAIEAFDLFNLSSFSIQTMAPRRPIYVPILARIPIIGPMFQFPRSPKVTRHESLILANTVILPRSVELQRFYSEDTVSPLAAQAREASDAPK